MELRTQVKPGKALFSFTHQDPILLLGSCFAENIGEKLCRYFFTADVNPFGTLYNPASIASALRLLLKGAPLSTANLIEREGLFHSFTHHSRFSGESGQACLEKINGRLLFSAANLLKVKRLIVAFGTAWVYRYKETGEVVANCHKFPDRLFSRVHLSVNEIVKEWSGVIETLLEVIPEIKILFTVSPVRHWKDGAHGNQLSKATLLLAQDKLLQLFPGQVDYFPAYEILLDELRDYRFYADDMLHPSSLAIDYIWERFSDGFFPRETQALLKEVEEVQQAVNHRPSNPRGEQYQQFMLATRQKMKRINRKIMSPELESEIERIENKVFLKETNK